MDESVTEWDTAVICGSMRYFHNMLVTAAELTLDRYIVLAPFAVKTDDASVALMLDDMHREKIRRANVVVFVIGVDKYMGESTLREYDYARELNKRIMVTETTWSSATMQG